MLSSFTLRLIVVASLLGAHLASDIEDLCDSEDPTVKRICQYFLAAQHHQGSEPKGSDELAAKLEQTIVQLSQTALQSLQSLTQINNKQVVPENSEVETVPAECTNDWTTFEARINVSLSAHQEQINVQSERTEQLTANHEDLTVRVVEIEQSLKLVQETPPCSCSPAPQRFPSQTKGEDFMDTDLSLRQDLLKMQYDLAQLGEKVQSSITGKTKELERSIGTMQSDLNVMLQQQESKIEAQSSQMSQLKSQMLDQLAGIRHYFMKTVTDFYERMLERQNLMSQRLNTVTNELSSVKHRGKTRSFEMVKQRAII